MKLTPIQQQVIDILKRGECRIYASHLYNYQKIYSMEPDPVSTKALLRFTRSTLIALIGKGLVKEHPRSKSTYVLSDWLDED